MSQALDNEPCAGSASAATLKSGRNTGASQFAVENIKIPLEKERDLRLQVVEALAFVQEMTPDLSTNDMFYLDRARDILERLVDEDHADQLSYGGLES